jgi:hypothetical protein
MYAAFSVIALLFFLTRRRKEGLRLRIGRSASEKPTLAQKYSEQYPEKLAEKYSDKYTEGISHIAAPGERPLNVVFNYNGHSWDAYEVLGLPAGSTPEKVEAAYQENMQSTDTGKNAFAEAAYQAIRSQWETYKKAK